MVDYLQELALVIEAFESSDIKYAVCGGMAVAVHGYVRMTVDLDFLVAQVDVDRCFEVLVTCGYEDMKNTIPLPSQGVTFYRTLKFLEQDHLPIDILPLPSDHPWLADRIRCPWSFGELWVMSKDRLIEMKSGSSRGKDRQDVDELKAQ